MAAARYRALLVLILLSWPSAAKRYSFEHYGQEQGLANALVRALAQDKTGFLWVGTRDGLFRYDGLRFQRFAVPDGLPEASIRTLHVTGEGTLWAGTQKGIARLAGSRFEPVPVEGETRSRLGIASDASGRVYVASSAGLFVAEGGGSLRRVDGPAGAIRGLWVDHDNIVWMGCGEAICRWDGRKSEVFGPPQGVPRGSWTGFQRDAAGALLARADSSLLVMRRDDNVFRKDLQFRFPGSDQLLLDRGGRLLAPSPGGIWMRGADEHWTRVSEQEGLPADRVNCLFEDREGLLWIGFADLGMARWRGRDEWESYTRADGLASNAVTAVRTTADGMLWVGSRSGLIRLDRKSGRAREISRGEVRSLAATPDGMIWSASSTDGLIRVDPKTLHVERIGSASGLSARKILSLWVDPGGSLWLACREGVYHSLPNAPRPTFEPVAIQILERGEEIYAVRTDTGGRLWLAGNRGLVIRDGGAWTRVGTNEGLRSRGLVFLTLGKDGSAWVGYDRYMGVSRINREPGHTRIRDFDQEGILRSNDVCFLETGERGWIWVGTDNGLDVYNGRNWRHFSSHDGLIWHDIVLNAFYQDADGSVWIGTNLGLSHYTPRESVFDVPAPVAALTNVSFGGEAAGLQTAQIKVPYKRRSAKISFTTLSFSRQHVTRFRYRLKGLDDTWVETRDREAVFPNLAPANYEFEVQAGADGRWNPLGASFSFHLEAPWWETNWFNGGLVLFLALTGGNIYLRRMKRGLVQRKELETAVAERTFELEMEKNRTEREKQIVEEHQREIENLLAKAQEASRLKGEFLANVSHEIRTPMNGMLGMTSLALQTPLTEDQRDYLETAKASGESLLCLLNDILDFSKIEANRLELEAVPFSLAASLEESVRSLAFQAQQRGLALDAIRNPGVPDIVIGDPGRLRQVLLNLLSNAIKFTNQGWVRLSVHTDHWDGPEAVLKFQVKDTGCGIPQDKQAVIFDAFRQADGSTTRKHGGTGLGLAICARLVGMMGGRIWVNSDGVNGSEFLFTAKFAVGASLPGNPPPAHQIGKLAAAVDKGGTRVLRVLVAEDNLVNQKLVVRLLEKQGHTVEVAANGAQALHMTSRMRYDLVLMDVQMPEVDGIETTRRIREREERTGDHLPILMLTANAMVGDREKCLQAGADGYLPKPVSTELLMSAIEKLA